MNPSRFWLSIATVCLTACSVARAQSGAPHAPRQDDLDVAEWLDAETEDVIGPMLDVHGPQDVFDLWKDTGTDVPRGGGRPSGPRDGAVNDARHDAPVTVDAALDASHDVSVPVRDAGGVRDAGRPPLVLPPAAPPVTSPILGSSDPGTAPMLFDAGRRPMR